MSSIMVQMPDDVQAFVDQQIRAGHFAAPEDFVLNLLVRERLRLDDEQKKLLAEKLIVGLEQLESGECKEMTSADWDRIRSDFLKRHEANCKR